MDESVELELEQARGALTDARVLLSGDGTDAGVVNRLYYAAFHAAQAVLYDRGEKPSSTATFVGCSASTSFSMVRRPAKRADFWELFMITDGRPTTVAVVPMPM